MSPMPSVDIVVMLRYMYALDACGVPNGGTALHTPTAW